MSSRAFPYMLAGCALILIAGLIFLLMPDMLPPRMARLEGGSVDRLWLVRAFGMGMIALSFALLCDTVIEHAPLLVRSVLVLLILSCFVLFSQQMADWWIDDAGITFAYSRSLAEGFGVTFQPGAPPTEGYSSSLWMVMLALAGWGGADIPMVAKHLGILFGAATLLICMHLVWIQTRSLSALVLTGAALSTAPFVIWSASGQEHALQGLLLMLCVYAAGLLQNWRLWVAILLALLVLTRPETPLLVISIFVMGMLRSFLQTRHIEIGRNLILAALPFAAFIALMSWRIWYFGDPMPNPYYAKTDGNSFIGLFNPFGGGWRYVIDGLRDSGLIVLLPLVFFLPSQSRNAALAVLAALLAGHIFFVVWAKGDWMGQYRFMMPVTALLALPALLALARVPSPWLRQGLCAVLSVVLLSGTVIQMDRFLAHPTTPLSVVSEIGREFAGLAGRMGLEDPVLAHHDAGGISYDREIGLVDLGGLVDREVARNMTDRAFLETYIFEQRKPDFIFGALNFAARSGFTQAPAFNRDYVPLVFENRPVMDSDLSHIRRDSLREASGVRIERNASGRVLRVIVTDPAL